MKRRKLLKHLSDAGCELRREGGRHSIWGHTGNRTSSSIPRHTEVDDFLVRKICRDLGVPLPGTTIEVVEETTEEIDIEPTE